MAEQTGVYHVEISDIHKVLNALEKAIKEVDTASLYIDTLEFSLAHDGGDVCFTGWWDAESECFKVEQAKTAIAVKQEQP